MSAYNLPNKPPPMKEMLTDMYECCNDLLENAGVSHDAVFVDLKKGSNAKFLQTNICLMMTLIGELIKSAEAGCGGCSEYIKELEEEIEQLKKDNKMLDVKQAKATKKADSQMKMKQQYEKQFDDISQQLNKLRQQLDKIDN